MDTPQAWEPPAQRNSQSLPFKPPSLLQPEKPLISSSLQRKLHFQRGVMEKCQLSGPSRKGSLVDLTVGEPKARTVTFRRTSQTHGIHVLYCCGEVCGWEGETHTQISACAFQICIELQHLHRESLKILHSPTRIKKLVQVLISYKLIPFFILFLNTCVCVHMCTYVAFMHFYPPLPSPDPCAPKDAYVKNHYCLGILIHLFEAVFLFLDLRAQS